jgi:hypothetical protein
MRRVAGLALVATVLAVGCTRDRPASTAGQPGTSPNSPGAGEPGTYRYEFNGVGATFRLQGSSGSIDIRNGTGSRLASPRLSILDASDGEELEAEIEDASPLGKRDRRTFEVSLGRAMHPRDIGLVVLSFGGEVWGALSPG